MTQHDPDLGASGDVVAHRPTINEVVESVGYGRAQLLVLFTGGAVLFNRGVQMCLMAILTIPVAKDFDLNHNQEGFLSSGMFAGMFLGTIASGYVGDKIGRRFPVCSSSIAVVIIGCLSSLSVNFKMLLAMRFFLGLAMAFGDVPATALFSEVSPARWKIPMRAFAEAFFDVGYTYAAALASFADPNLRELQWKRLLLFASIPPGAMGLLAAFFLPESPVFLAHSGRRQEAIRVFKVFARLNGKPETNVEYEDHEQEKCGRNDESPLEQLRVVFGPRFMRITLILAYVSFTLNVFYYGGMYAQPQVMTKGKGLAPGWEIVIGGPFDMVGIIVAMVIAQMIPRKPALCFALAMAGISIFCFGFAGSVAHRTYPLEIMYQFGVFGFYWVPAIGFIVFSQVAVETFPTLASTTGGSITFCSGRFGALAAPMLFENLRAATKMWQLFCYLSAAFSVLALMLLAADAAVGDPTCEDPYETTPARRMALVDAEAGRIKGKKK